jgi:hypothetical protein
MKLFIPACGDRITLEELWTFDLYLERRNMQFAKIRDLVDQKADDWGVFEGERHASGYARAEVTLPVGTVLECCRVYIRTFNKSALEESNDYDSITWRVMKGNKPATKQRFWAKLVDCCKIEFSIANDGTYRDRVKLLKLVCES